MVCCGLPVLDYLGHLTFHLRKDWLGQRKAADGRKQDAGGVVE